jgi:hypothetical protein
VSPPSDRAKKAGIERHDQFSDDRSTGTYRIGSSSYWRSRARKFALAIQPGNPFRYSLTRLARNSNDLHVTMNGASIFFGGADIEWHVGQQVDLVENQKL